MIQWKRLELYTVLAMCLVGRVRKSEVVHNTADTWPASLCAAIFIDFFSDPACEGNGDYW